MMDLDAQRRTEDALREHIEFTERLIDSSDDCIKVLDLDARLISMSANGMKLLRIMDFATVEGANWIDFWKDEDRAAAVAAVNAAREGGTGRFTGFFPVEGEPRWFDVVVTPINDAHGRPERLLAVSREVTAQRRTQEALRESEARYRAFTEALPGMTWSASPQGRLEFVGERWSQTRGRPREDALGDAWLDGVHADDRAATQARWRHSLESGEPYAAQFRVRMADGAYRWQLVRALPVADEAGAIARWVGVNLDVDEQRRADEAREMFVALAENSSDFIGIGDNDGNAIYVNEAGRRLLEIGSLDEARATHLMDYFRPEDRDYVRNHILPVVEREGRWVGDFRFRNFRTGAPVSVAYNFFKLVDKDGKSLGIATVSRDRRERERVEDGVRLLSRTGAATLDSLDSKATLRNIARAVVGEFAALCVIDVLDAKGRWQRVALAHRDAHRERVLEQTRDLSQPVREHPVARALLDGVSSVATIDAAWTRRFERSDDRIEAAETLGARSLVTVPVVTPSGAVLGALTCVRDAADPRDDYREADLGFVEEVGRRAGAAIANAQLYERERRIAVELQDASLPSSLPSVHGLELDADYRPGSDEATIGGDWYDAFVLDDGRVAITVGDVLGHGLHAAVTMTKLRQAMQSAAMVDPDPNMMLDVADKTLRLLDADGYATALAALYDAQAHTLTFASAGHAGPVVRAPDGRIEDFTSPGGMLGLRTHDERDTKVVPALPGTVMVFYTDGLTEATHDIDEGQRRLHEVLGRDDVVHGARPARTIVERVLRDTQAGDDIAVLVARIGPSR